MCSPLYELVAGWGVDRRRPLLGQAGLMFARWPDSVFLATTEAICGGHPVEAQYDALRQKLLLVAACVTHGINWPPRSLIEISLNSLNRFLRSNPPCGIHSNQQTNAESASGADEIFSQNLHFRPRYALFLHFRPTYAIFGSALAQPSEREISFSRPTYGTFGSQFMP